MKRPKGMVSHTNKSTFCHDREVEHLSQFLQNSYKTCRSSKTRKYKKMAKDSLGAFMDIRSMDQTPDLFSEDHSHSSLKTADVKLHESQGSRNISYVDVVGLDFDSNDLVRHHDDRTSFYQDGFECQRKSAETKHQKKKFISKHLKIPKSEGGDYSQCFKSYQNDKHDILTPSDTDITEAADLVPYIKQKLLQSFKKQLASDYKVTKSGRICPEICERSFVGTVTQKKKKEKPSSVTDSQYELWKQISPSKTLLSVNEECNFISASSVLSMEKSYFDSKKKKSKVCDESSDSVSGSFLFSLDDSEDGQNCKGAKNKLVVENQSSQKALSGNKEGYSKSSYILDDMGKAKSSTKRELDTQTVSPPFLSVKEKVLVLPSNADTSLGESVQKKKKAKKQIPTEGSYCEGTINVRKAFSSFKSTAFGSGQTSKETTTENAFSVVPSDAFAKESKNTNKENCQKSEDISSSCEISTSRVISFSSLICSKRNDMAVEKVEGNLKRKKSLDNQTKISGKMSKGSLIDTSKMGRERDKKGSWEIPQFDQSPVEVSCEDYPFSSLYCESIEGAGTIKIKGKEHHKTGKKSTTNENLEGDENGRKKKLATKDKKKQLPSDNKSDREASVISLNVPSKMLNSSKSIKSEKRSRKESEPMETLNVKGIIMQGMQTDRMCEKENPVLFGSELVKVNNRRRIKERVKEKKWNDASETVLENCLIKKGSTLKLDDVPYVENEVPVIYLDESNKLVVIYSKVKERDDKNLCNIAINDAVLSSEISFVSKDDCSTVKKDEEKIGKKGKKKKTENFLAGKDLGKCQRDSIAHHQARIESENTKTETKHESKDICVDSSLSEKCISKPLSDCKSFKRQCKFLKVRGVCQAPLLNSKKEKGHSVVNNCEPLMAGDPPEKLSGNFHPKTKKSKVTSSPTSSHRPLLNDTNSSWHRLSFDSNGSFSQEQSSSIFPGDCGKSAVENSSNSRQIHAHRDFHHPSLNESCQDSSSNTELQVGKCGTINGLLQESICAHSVEETNSSCHGDRKLRKFSSGKEFVKSKCSKLDKPYKLQPGKVEKPHKQRTLLDSKFRCTRCNIQFESASSMMRHDCRDLIRRKSKLDSVKTQASLNKCKHCGKTYLHIWHLNHHVRSTHLKLRRYVCDVCSMSFSEKQTLVVHMRMHTGLKPYNCRICNDDFVTTSKVHRHYEKVHNLLKKFRCHDCKLSYYFDKDLTIHRLVHSKKTIKAVKNVS